MDAIHPGEHLAEELAAINLSAAAFSRQIAVPTNRVTEILNGRRSITGDTALRLAHFFGTNAEFWLNLQSLYEIRLAQRKSGRAIKALPTIKNLRLQSSDTEQKRYTARDKVVQSGSSSKTFFS